MSSSTLSALTIWVLVAMLHGPVGANPKPGPQKLGVREIEVKAEQIVFFDRAAPGRRKFGELTFLGGLRLTSSERSFGGWSGLALETDGRGFIAVSDAGSWMTGQLRYRAGIPLALEDVQTGPLKTMSGQILRRERDRDAEAVELVSGTVQQGRVVIAYEQNHRIERFTIGPQGLSAPTSSIRPDNRHGRMLAMKGFEATTLLTKGLYRGSLVAIAESKHDGKGRHTGWIWTRHAAKRIAIVDIGGFDITGAAVLPDGDLILLERRFNWIEGVKMRLRRIPIDDLRPDSRIRGEVLLEANMGQNIDNMEGLAVHRDRQGSSIITLLSDDNFNPLLQRTILLQFRLDTPGKRVDMQ